MTNGVSDTAASPRCGATHRRGRGFGVARLAVTSLLIAGVLFGATGRHRVFASPAPPPPSQAEPGPPSVRIAAGADVAGTSAQTTAPTPAFSGTGAIGHSITVSVEGAAACTAVVGGDGIWSCAVSGLLAAGVYAVTINQSGTTQIAQVALTIAANTSLATGGADTAATLATAPQPNTTTVLAFTGGPATRRGLLGAALITAGAVLLIMCRLIAAAARAEELDPASLGGGRNL